MKKNGFTVSMRCLLDLGKDVALGMCLDEKYTPFSCLSFPSTRFKEDSLENRLKVLMEANTEFANTVIGYFYDGDYCFLVQSKQDALAQFGQIWTNIAPLVNSPGMEMYKSLSLQFCYALAVILGFLNKHGIGAPSDAYHLATFRNAEGKMIPCFTGLGLPEIFGENNSTDYQSCYAAFHKIMVPSATVIPSYQDVIANPLSIGCSVELIQDVVKQQTCPSPRKKKSNPWKLTEMAILSPGLKTLPENVALDICSSNRGVFLCISTPQQRITGHKICERLVALKGDTNRTINKITGYAEYNSRMYLAQENDEVLCCVSDFWDGVKGNLANIGMEEYRDHGMRFCYSLAYILAKLEELDVGTSKNVPAYELAMYVDDFVPCFTGLYFPEAFGEVNGGECNQKYFECFCNIMMPYLKWVPSYQDVVSGAVLLPGTEERRNDIVALCGGNVDSLTGDVVETICEKEKTSSRSVSRVSDSEDTESEESEKGWKLAACEERILYDPCFTQDGAESRPYSIDLVRYMQECEWVHNGSRDFVPRYGDDWEDEEIIRSLGSEFQAGMIINQRCLRHKMPNNALSIKREKEVIETVNNPLIPVCIQQKGNEFLYVIGTDEYHRDDYFYNQERSCMYFVMGLLSLLHDLHRNGFLYLRWDPNNIFKKSNGPMYVIGFDTCMKIGDPECTSEMVDWDDHPSEATDLICIGSLLYWLFTGGRLLFDDLRSKESNREAFKRGIKITEDEISTGWVRKLVQKLISPDVAVRKSVNLWEVFNDWNVRNEYIEIPILMRYSFGRETRLYSNSGEFGIYTDRVYCDQSKLCSFSIDHRSMTYTTEYKDCTCEVCICEGRLTFSMSGKSSFRLRTDDGCVWGESTVDEKTTEIQWSDRGLMICFPGNDNIGIRIDGTIVFPNGKGKAKNRIENGNLVIDGECLKLTHYGSAIEFSNGDCTFKISSSNLWEVHCGLMDVRYSPDEFFVQTPFGWLKYRDSRVETYSRGTHILFTDDTIQYKSSFLEMTSNSEGKARFRILDKELIARINPNPIRMTWFDLPEPNLPPIPMTGMQKKSAEPGSNASVQKHVAAQESVTDKPPDFYGIWRGNFDKLYAKIMAQKPRIVLEVPEENKAAKKIRMSKKKIEPVKPKENPKVPVMAEVVSAAKISKEVIGNDFGVAQVIGKVQRLLKGGDDIAYVCEVTERIFLGSSRTRKMVISTSGSVFYTNIGGDGILAHINLKTDSTVSVKGRKIKIRAANGSFRFLSNDSAKLAEKLNECIRNAEE